MRGPPPAIGPQSTRILTVGSAFSPDSCDLQPTGRGGCNAKPLRLVALVERVPYVLWAELYWSAPLLRRMMLRVSLATSLFGLTESLFVLSYWNLPSLFELAQRTRFDLESLGGGALSLVLCGAFMLALV